MHGALTRVQGEIAALSRADSRVEHERAVGASSRESSRAPRREVGVEGDGTDRGGVLAEDALVDAQAVDGDGAVLGAAGDELGARVEADVVDGAGVRGETANLDAVRVEDVDAAGLGAERDEALRRARARREVGREELGDAAAQAAVLEYRLLLRILGRRGRGVRGGRQRRGRGGRREGRGRARLVLGFGRGVVV